MVIGCYAGGGGRKDKSISGKVGKGQGGKGRIPLSSLQI